MTTAPVLDPAEIAPESPVRVALALGSNLGDRAAYLRAAVAALRRVVAVEAVSSVYATDPVGPAQPEFLNAALVGTTRLAPRALLAGALRAEAEAGRLRLEHEGPRTLDVDLVLYGDRVLRVRDLTIPHPRWRERGFVLAPLREIAADWVDPETGRTIGMLSRDAEQMPGRPRAVGGPELIDPRPSPGAR